MDLAASKNPFSNIMTTCLWKVESVSNKEITFNWSEAFVNVTPNAKSMAIVIHPSKEYASTGLRVGGDVGELDGEVDGELDGEWVGVELGAFDGEVDGELEGEVVGWELGELDGKYTGELEGESVGCTEGSVGELVGVAIGIRVGAGEGGELGDWLGAALGALVTPKNVVTFPHSPKHLHVESMCII